MFQVLPCTHPRIVVQSATVRVVVLRASFLKYFRPGQPPQHSPGLVVDLFHILMNRWKQEYQRPTWLMQHERPCRWRSFLESLSAQLVPEKGCPMGRFPSPNLRRTSSLDFKRVRERIRLLSFCTRCEKGNLRRWCTHSRTPFLTLPPCQALPLGCGQMIDQAATLESTHDKPPPHGTEELQLSGGQKP